MGRDASADSKPLRYGPPLNARLFPWCLFLCAHNRTPISHNDAICTIRYRDHRGLSGPERLLQGRVSRSQMQAHTADSHISGARHQDTLEKLKVVLSLTRQFASEARPRFSTHTQVVVGLRGYSGSAREENSNTSKEKKPSLHHSEQPTSTPSGEPLRLP